MVCRTLTTRKTLPEILGSVPAFALKKNCLSSPGFINYLYVAMEPANDPVRWVEDPDVSLLSSTALWVIELNSPGRIDQRHDLIAVYPEVLVTTWAASLTPKDAQSQRSNEITRFHLCLP